MLQSCECTLPAPHRSIGGQAAALVVKALAKGGEPLLTPFALSLSEVDQPSAQWQASAATVSILAGASPFPWAQNPF